VIKKLKVGNSTFYDKILRPLWNYGLINLQFSRKGGYHVQLILYAFPLSQPDKATLPLQRVRNYDDDFLNLPLLAAK
jgi:hypothetical protein